MTSTPRVGMVVRFDSDRWTISGIGHTREDGRTYLHLASVTRGVTQRNGFRPVQIADWFSHEELESEEVARLSERLRPNVEAAPWVVGEVVKLESIVSELLEALRSIVGLVDRHADLTVADLSVALNAARAAIAKADGEAS